MKTNTPDKKKSKTDKKESLLNQNNSMNFVHLANKGEKIAEY